MLQYNDLERISFSQEMTEDEWKALCAKAYPLMHGFRSTGKGGWVNLMSVENMPALVRSTDDRWWTDCNPYQGPLHDPHGMNGRLVGTYNFANGRGVGTIYYKVKGVELQ